MNLLLTIGILGAAFSAGVVDRVAAVVDKTVILESEVLREMRLTAFLNQQPFEPNPEKRRAAAERLVDQALLRQEMEVGQYPMPSPAEADQLLQHFRQENYPNDAAFHAVLNKYGITEEQLKQHLLWQAAVLNFVDTRFHPAVSLPTDGESTDGQSANRASADAAVSPDDAVENQMENWLKEKRNSTRIQFKKEAFQ